MISKESQIIYLLTGWLPSIVKDDQMKPLSAREWSKVAQKIYTSELNKPSDLLPKSQTEITNILNLDPELSKRIIQLLTRSGQVVFELEKYRTQGYELLTRADADYPKKLKKKMQNELPPYFWYFGNADIFNQFFISMQFSNNKDDSVLTFIKEGILEIKKNNYSIALSFNDEYSIEVAKEAINNEIQVLGIIPFGLLKLIKQALIRDLLATRKLLLISQSYPSISKYYKYNGMLQKKVELAISEKIMILNSGTLNEIIYSEIQKITNDEIYIYNLQNNLKSDTRLSEYIPILNISQIFSSETIEPVSDVIDNNDDDNDNIIYTIGHSNHTIEKFLDLLKEKNIEKVIEVRSTAKSRYLPHFNKQPLIYSLKKNGIQYLDRGKSLGGRPEDTSVLNKDNKILEDKIETKVWYQDGIKELIKLSKKNRIVLMCSEENPLNCHRGYIISHTLLKNGIKIEHIRGSGKKNKGKRFVKKELHQGSFFE